VNSNAVKMSRKVTGGQLEIPKIAGRTPAQPETDR